MSDQGKERIVLAVLSAPDSSPWPGLEPLEPEAEILHVTALDQLREALTRADVLLVTDFNTKLLQDAWSSAGRLRWIHATSAGVDAILLPGLIASDIPVTNARGIFDQAIAETVLGLVLVYAKDLRGTLDRQRQHRWEHRDSERIRGKRMLVVGAGSVGRAIARLARSVGMAVEGIARSERPRDPDFTKVFGRDAFFDRLAEADYVVVAAPLTPETEGMFDAAAFAAMKQTARLINVGRGEIVRTDALVRALGDGRLAGAALDVFEQEPLPADHPLWGMPGVIVSPHMAGDYLGWREVLSQQFIENFHRWRRGEPLTNVVDKRKGYGNLGYEPK